MKKILFIFINVITSLLCHSQQPKFIIDEVTHNITIEEVKEIPNKSKSELYSDVKTWFGETFINSEDVITSDNSEKGVVIGNFNYTFYIGLAPHTYRHKIKISTKNNKYKVIISNIVSMDYGGTLEKGILKKDGTYKNFITCIKIKNKIEKNCIRLFENLYSYLSDDSKDDW